MPKFKKKPTIIEAEQFLVNELPLPFPDDQPCKLSEELGWYVDTKEGPLKFSEGYWIVKGHTEGLGDHFWAVDPEYFADNYEPA